MIAFFLFFLYNIPSIRTWLSLVERLLWGSEATAASGGVKGAERVAAVGS